MLIGLRKIPIPSATLARCASSNSAAPAASRGTERPKGLQDIVLIDAVRTPFAVSSSVYKDLLAVDLQRAALAALVERTNVEFDDIAEIVCGTVVQESRTSNIAREAALTAGFPNRIPCNTVTLACISSNLAVANLIGNLKTGHGEAAIAGGVEFLTDVPIRYNRVARTAMRDLTRAKSLPEKLKLGSTLLSQLLSPELPAIAEFTSGETMGQSGDRLAAAFGVSRREQDEFALRSHTMAEKATKEGKLKDLTPYFVPRGKKQATISTDNTVRITPMEKLEKLKPAFIKPHGTVTAGNSSPLTDGASAALISTADFASRKGFKPSAIFRDFMFVAQDPKDQLLLGPAYVTPRILERNGLTLKDVDVFELHEAFAGQVLANLNALDSEQFCQKYMNLSGKFGRIPMEKLNNWGGSLSLGHPFGATGIRLIAHAANRLEAENGRFALIAACAAGGHGVGMLLERFDAAAKK